MFRTIPVQLTPTALNEVRNIFMNKNIPEGYGLRIGVKGGGCAGVSFVLGFDKPTDSDDQYMIDTIPVFIQKKDVMHLIGMQVDYLSNDQEQGFVFKPTEL